MGRRPHCPTCCRAAPRDHRRVRSGHERRCSGRPSGRVVERRRQASTTSSDAATTPTTPTSCFRSPGSTVMRTVLVCWSGRRPCRRLKRSPGDPGSALVRRRALGDRRLRSASTACGPRPRRRWEGATSTKAQSRSLCSSGRKAPAAATTSPPSTSTNDVCDVALRGVQQPRPWPMVQCGGGPKTDSGARHTISGISLSSTTGAGYCRLARAAGNNYQGDRSGCTSREHA